MVPPPALTDYDPQLAGKDPKAPSARVAEGLLGKGLEERPQLFFHVGRLGEGLRDCFAE